MKETKGVEILSVEELLAHGPAAVRDAYQGAADALEGAALIRTMRNLAGLSKSDLARKLEVKPARISALEKGAGRQGPTYALLKRVARVCNVEFDLRKAITRRPAATQAAPVRPSGPAPSASSVESVDRYLNNIELLVAKHPMASLVKLATKVPKGGRGNIGTVRWFNAEKGFGFIAPDDGSTGVGFQRSKMFGTSTPMPGQKVTFELLKRNRGPARNISRSQSQRSQNRS